MEKLEIEQNIYGWFIASANRTWDAEYLWHDLTLHPCDTGGIGGSGYYATKAEAERYLMAYRVKGMKFNVGRCRNWPERGWYIITDTGAGYGKEQFVWRDLELHTGTGLKPGHYGTGEAPGYYQSEHHAQLALIRFKEKHSMVEDTIKINVEINGVVKSLYDLSEESILKIRNASKPKPVPVFQVCDYKSGGRRLVLKVTPRLLIQLKCRAGQYAFIDESGDVCNGDETIEGASRGYDLYTNFRELKLGEV